MITVNIRRGTAADAGTLRRVYSEASHGISDYLWLQSWDGEEDFDAMVAARMQARIADPRNHFWVAERDGVPAGGVLSYAKGPEPEDGGRETGIIRAFIVAENAVVSTRYINAIAVFPEFRQLGIARRLIDCVRGDAIRNGDPGLGLLVSNANPVARIVYATTGFEEIGRFPMAKDGWDGPGDAWIAMRRAA